MERETIRALPEEHLKDRGALLIHRITDGMEEYESLILNGSIEEYHVFLRGLLRENGTQDSFADFYYSMVSEEARAMIMSVLTPEEKIIISSLDTSDGIYYPLTEELLPVLLKLTSREILFSTFYFSKYPCTLWGNYDMQYPVLFRDGAVREHYEGLIRQIF